MILPDGPPKNRTTDVPFARRRIALFRIHKIRAVALCLRPSPSLPQPKSRSNPQFESTALRQALKDAGIAYVHEPLLGGLRRAQKDSVNDGWRNASFRGFADYMATDDFTRGLGTLLRHAAKTTTAIMCAEAVPWRCHRSLVADALKASGRHVLHIVSRSQPSPHRYTPFLRRRRGVLTYPASAISAR